MKPGIPTLLSLVAVAMITGIAQADVTIYADDFSGSSATDLHGLAPDTRPGSETWSAATQWKADGTMTTTDVSAGAYLPFTPEGGQVYTLSMDVDVSAGTINWGSGNWIGLAFRNSNNTSDYIWNTAAPWMLDRLEGEVVTFSDDLNGQVTESVKIDGTVNLKMVLDTTNPSWSVGFYRNDTLLSSHTYTTNPTISHVGIGTWDGGTTTGTVDNFRLTVAGSGARITSFTGIGGGVWELTLLGDADTGYEFRSSTTLDFNPGTLVENLTAGVPAVGTIGGTNDSVLTTDSNGDATVRMTLAGPRNFVRAQEAPPPPPVTLLSADFEASDGGFTSANLGTGTIWEWGAPNSTDLGGGAIIGGAGTPPSAKAWGTNLSGAYLAGTDTALRSPVIDLTGATGATLSFARAMDADAAAEPPHTLEVNVIEAATDTVIAQVIAPTTDPETTAAPWQQVDSVAIPAAALGKQVRLEWRFTGNGDGSYLGAYIDDVLVTVP